MKKEIKTQLKHEKKSFINFGWIIKITILSFIISIIFSIAAELISNNVNIGISIIVLLAFIIIGIIFDMIGVAVTSADETPFHSMSSRKVKGSKMAVYLKKNADKVSSFCNDVIGDICGIVSGATGATVALWLSINTSLNLLVSSLLVTAIIASLTIGGKATFKSIAINSDNEILYMFAKILSFIKIKDK